MLMEGAAEGGVESDGRTLTESIRGKILRELGERAVTSGSATERAYLFISVCVCVCVCVCVWLL